MAKKDEALQKIESHEKLCRICKSKLMTKYILLKLKYKE